MNVCSKAIVLAAGLGTRMRSANADASLTPIQAAMAEQGLKAMIPFGRPFLDYSLNSIADAGYRHVCLVIGPAHSQVRDYYSLVSCERLRIEFAIQQRPLGTADALSAAAQFAGDDDVLVLNGDNHYPTAALSALREVSGNALIGFDSRALLAEGDIPAERISAYSVVECSSDGFLTNIVEKPGPELLEVEYTGPRLISMNCWRFQPSIFQACRAIGPSPRGEYELPDAVRHSVHELGERFRIIPLSASVSDLSSRSDIARIQRRFAKVEVRL